MPFMNIFLWNSNMRLIMEPSCHEIDDDRLPLMFEETMQAHRPSSQDVEYPDAPVSSSSTGVFSSLASTYAANRQSNMNNTGAIAAPGPRDRMIGMVPTVMVNRRLHHSGDHLVLHPQEARNSNNTILAQQRQSTAAPTYANQHQELIKATFPLGLPLSQQHKHQRFLPSMSVTQQYSSTSTTAPTNTVLNTVASSAQLGEQDPLTIAEWHLQQANGWSHVAASRKTNSIILQQRSNLPSQLMGILTGGQQQLSSPFTTAHAASPPVWFPKDQASLQEQYSPMMFPGGPSAEHAIVLPGESTRSPVSRAFSSTAKSIDETTSARGRRRREQRINDEHDGPSRRKGNSHGTLRLIRPMDVVTNKGRGPQEHHPGNLFYRRLIDENQRDYVKMDKSRSSVILKIVRTIEDHDGWFVEPTERGAKYGVHLGTYKVRKKISDDLNRYVRRQREAKVSAVKARK